MKEYKVRLEITYRDNYIRIRDLDLGEDIANLDFPHNRNKYIGLSDIFNRIFFHVIGGLEMVKWGVKK